MGLPIAALPIIKPAAPVTFKQDSADFASVTSPFAITGIDTEFTIWLMESQSAMPEYRCLSPLAVCLADEIVRTVSVAASAGYQSKVLGVARDHVLVPAIDIQASNWQARRAAVAPVQ